MNRTHTRASTLLASAVALSFALGTRAADAALPTTIPVQGTLKSVGGGPVAVVNGTPDHHGSNYWDLNASCVNDYVYTYGGNFFGTNLALGTGWPQTNSCSSSGSDDKGTWIGVR